MNKVVIIVAIMAILIISFGIMIYLLFHKSPEEECVEIENEENETDKIETIQEMLDRIKTNTELLEDVLNKVREEVQKQNVSF